MRVRFPIFLLIHRYSQQVLASEVSEAELTSMKRTDCMIRRAGAVTEIFPDGDGSAARRIFGQFEVD